VLTTREETEMNRIFVALLLSTVIAFPTLAQQPTSSSSTQTSASTGKAAPVSTGETATGQAPLREIKGEDFWDGDEPGAVALISHPFASKGYVQRQIAPIRDRLNELEELTAGNSKKIKDIDDHSQGGIQLVSKKTDEADQHALDAANKAQTAQQAAAAVNTHLSRVEPVVQSIDQYKAGTPTEIRFRAGQTVLSKDAKNALDEMATALKDQHGYVIEVEGFSSSRGQAGIAASRRMADSVARYLVLNHEIPAYRIYVVGLGNAPVVGEEASTAKRTSGNHVRISVLKNGLDQVASSPASDTSTSPK
jgi:outer membrane protein OmpA-like peptidoglycan-associated protein